jgi:hypothetical protein
MDEARERQSLHYLELVTGMRLAVARLEYENQLAKFKEVEQHLEEQRKTILELDALFQQAIRRQHSEKETVMDESVGQQLSGLSGMGGTVPPYQAPRQYSVAERLAGLRVRLQEELDNVFEAERLMAEQPGATELVEALEKVGIR